jgi:pimeloyl-ACP methyl ester carboxylesterase
VIAPDQINFGKSSKLDDVPVSFGAMAAHTAALLDYLIVERVVVVAHSMGNMAAVRFARTYPDRVGKLVMYGPVGLEDYRFYVPPVPEERLVEQEDKLTAEAYLNQLVTTYGLTLPKHEVQPFVDIRERMKGSAEWPRWVRSFVSSYYAMWGNPWCTSCRWLTSPCCSSSEPGIARRPAGPLPSLRIGTGWAGSPNGRRNSRRG